ncbi:chorismate mutase [Chondromyces apiculatus]|uniref:chorismate mutase n=1 Tax=Chondromyces apiculatus DSM 436 TaxID=1192034 RepID=A0A017TA34_9BACT|nr:chorismate mutase [Chondromyces apiculatus]EYF05685.1 Prephenate dehydrogenase [Chondromyces apiculatus DSM 436]
MDDPSTHAPDLLASRDTLDRLDRALLELIAQRRAVVEALFEVKLRQALPLLDPERESALLAQRRALAEALGVPGDLAERLFRVILEGSHAQASACAMKPERSE